MSTRVARRIESKHIMPILVWLSPIEREIEPEPTRPFYVRGVTFLRFGIGGRWGCAAIEVSR